jgi:erythromycin esterase-like protein
LAARLGDADAKDLRRTIRSLSDGLVFIEACNAGLGSPEGTVGLRNREECMARNMDEVLDALAPGERIILLAHNMHLGKDSSVLQAGWLDAPRLKMWPSIGSHLARKLPGQVYSVWMLYDHGRHGKLLHNTAVEEQVSSSARAIEHLLAEAGSAFLLPLHTGDARESYLDQMRDFRQNGRPASGILKRQADAIFFVAEVNPPGRQEADDL